MKYSCSACQKRFRDESAYQDHKRSAAHMEKVRPARATVDTVAYACCDNVIEGKHKFDCAALKS